jgi:hypothetical protein
MALALSSDRVYEGVCLTVGDNVKGSKVLMDVIIKQIHNSEGGLFF